MNLKKDKWEVALLGDICKLEYGNNLTEKMRNGGDIPVFGSAGVVGYHNESLTKSPTLIIGRKGSVGNVFYSSVPCFPIDTTFYVEEKACFEDLEWIKLFLTYYDLRKLNMATAVPGLSRNIANLIEVPIPPPDIKKSISSIFKSIEAVIVQLESQVGNIESLLKTLVNGLLESKPNFGTLIKEKNLIGTKFGELVECIEKHDKEKKDITRFVGLENIEARNLKIGTWGNISKGTTFTKRFNTGDVLFGKRRSYLKKVAVADFDGICSGDILVFRAKEGKILPGLLPYYVASDAFMQHAVRTSAGSLSPRTKWKDLKEFMISIPDLQAQGKVLVVLNHTQTVLNLIKGQKGILQTLKQNLLNEIFS